MRMVVCVVWLVSQTVPWVQMVISVSMSKAMSRLLMRTPMTRVCTDPVSGLGVGHMGGLQLQPLLVLVMLTAMRRFWTRSLGMGHLGELQLLLLPVTVMLTAM